MGIDWMDGIDGLHAEIVPTPPQVKPCNSGQHRSYLLNCTLATTKKIETEGLWSSLESLDSNDIVITQNFRKKLCLIDKDSMNIKLPPSNQLKASEMGRCRLALLAVLVTSISSPH